VTVFEECNTEEQSSVVLFLFWCAKSLNAKDKHKEMFPVYGEKCLSRKAVHNWVANVSLMMRLEREVRKWLRQQSKDFYAAGFDSQLMQSAGASVSVLAEDIPRNKRFPSGSYIT
jgi:hypothetical protein